MLSVDDLTRRLPVASAGRPAVIVTAQQPVGLAGQFLQQWRGVPVADRDEVMEAIVCAEAEPFGHRLDALALARTDQAGDVERAHPLPRLVPEPGEKRREPTLKLRLPTRANHLSRHDRLPAADPS